MCSVLMSIKPEYVVQILNGKKKYEYRKRACKRNVDKIFIYATVPECKVVGEVAVKDVIIKNVDQLWAMTKSESGINKEFFDKYFADKEEGVAYQLGEVVQYEHPKMLDELGVKKAPQSYQYID